MNDINTASANIQPKKRSFLPEDFQVSTWEQLQPYFDELSKRELTSLQALHAWLSDLSELESVIGEDACWRQIKMTCDTTDPKLEEAFTYFVTEIEPRLKPYMFAINRKLLDCPYKEQLDDQQYFPYLRGVANSVSLYREENIPLQSEISLLAQQYGVISGAMTIEENGKTLTLQQAAKLLHDPSRVLRKDVFEKVAQRRLTDRDKLNELFDKLLQLRHQVAVNAGFDNYRDYKFRELGRFDYTPDDCFAFHEAVKEHIVPLQRSLLEYRKALLGIESMKPYDTDAEPEGQTPLQPFHSGAEMLEKSIAVFSTLRPFFGDCLRRMKEMGRMDLDSRIGKAPGGYNCPLPETGVPFIFMNAAGTVNDLITMMHEGGHAIHSFLSHKLPLAAFKEYPMEIAELASMSMELFTLEHWQQFFATAEECRRAQWEELERVIDVLPWIATIDKFQHWLYTHPGHTAAEREQEWLRIHEEFSTGIVEWQDFETYRASFWQKQLHLFEVPFYYIEYGIAQLGAIAMWRQYKQNKEQALDNYMNALSLGYTRTLGQLYETAGIRFDFSPAYIRELSAFVQAEMQLLSDSNAN
ncbi:M3 family oligoendopeptidase [Rurimicrobium arvi]|uniref:M3 family oligoendopeptidase n=1 Tax=Rurimicrobium arvi TaxID=2049916 RepID=A0ABP8MHF9_9BACT